MHNETVKKRRNENGKKEQDSRVKTWKGSLKRKRENFWRFMGRANKRMKRATIGQHQKHLWDPQTLPKSKNLNLLFKSAFPKFLSLSRWVLTPVKLSYSETRKKWIFLRCLIFKKFVFQKKTLETCHPFAQPNCENKSFELDHQIPSQCPFGDF